MLSGVRQELQLYGRRGCRHRVHDGQGCRVLRCPHRSVQNRRRRFGRDWRRSLIQGRRNRLCLLSLKQEILVTPGKADFSILIQVDRAVLNHARRGTVVRP